MQLRRNHVFQWTRARTFLWAAWVVTPFEALFVGHLNRMMQRVLGDAVPRLEMFGYKLASSH